mgnify:CR=1 FL=1
MDVQTERTTATLAAASSATTLATFATGRACCAGISTDAHDTGPTAAA